MGNRWIQGAHLKKGTLHEQLGIPQGQNIPTGILNEIKTAKVGGHVKGPHGAIPVTGLLKRRANLAKTLRVL